MSTVTTAIVDYGLGNVASVRNALTYLGTEVTLSSDFAVLDQADCLILPGVGSFEDGMKKLQGLDLIPILNELVINKGKPILGICLGMQLMAKRGFENGEFEGLGWIDAEVQKLSVSGVKIPHVGWNETNISRQSKLWPEVPTQCFYYVHSYHMVCNDLSDIAALCHHGKNFTAAIERNNIMGVQFHPEKSQKDGLSVLKAFLTEARGAEILC
ncbi:MAG: imidazole glycerol phosphate synthase subunit HisH [Candidatus Melainabacteria bacterium]|nr:imidazole glycerol phosphate synthase subunit HisH [Candidatus Melainabacteria bacterium]